jgi:hypothetical protein
MSGAAMAWRWLLPVAVSCLAAVQPVAAQGVSRNEAISIALAEAHRRYVVQEDHPVWILVEDANGGRVRWARQLARNPELARAVEGRSYWAIQVESNPGPNMVIIGNLRLIVFVERAGGAVLGALRLAGEFE